MTRIYQLLIILLAVALVWALLAQKCSKDKPTIVEKINTVIKKDTEAMLKVEEQADIIARQDSIILNMGDDLDRKDKNLRTANRTATQLANDLAEAKLKHDTIAYEKICDSLGNAAVQWEVDYKNISDSAREVIGLLKSQGRHKDTIILTQEQSRQRLLSALNEAKSLLSPKRHVYAGVSVGSTATSFEYLKVDLYYFDKKGNGYGLGAGTMKTGEMLYEAKYLRQIF